MIITNRNEIKNYTTKKTAVALGSFDAIHKGHIKVISAAVCFAKENGLLSLVQIFENPGMKEALNSTSDRIEILKSLNVDIVVIEKFDEEFKSTSYSDFVRDYINARYNAAAVFAGQNYRFGYMAKGDSALLFEECLKYNIKANIINCLEIDGIVSSTKIRKFVKAGDMERVTQYMTRPYKVRGTVVHGREIGRKLGFPTANINLPEEKVVPKEGVYLTRVILGNGEIFFGITNVGKKPTVNITSANIETHISDFKGDIYGQEIEIEFLKRIRDIKKFDSIDLLKDQLKEDLNEIPK